MSPSDHSSVTFSNSLPLLAVFHSSQVDDPNILADGWWIGKVSSDDGTSMTTDGARGPYYHYQDAIDSMVLIGLP